MRAPFRRPEEYGDSHNLDFLKSMFADKYKSKRTKPTHAELRTMAIQEKKINIKVKEERIRAHEERARRTALLQAEQNVVQAQLEIDDYKAKYKQHEIFVFRPNSLKACHDHVKEMEQQWRDDVMAQMRLHRQTPSTLHRLRMHGADRIKWSRNPAALMAMTTATAAEGGGSSSSQHNPQSVENMEMVACLAQVRRTTSSLSW